MAAALRRALMRMPLEAATTRGLAQCFRGCVLITERRPSLRRVRWQLATSRRSWLRSLGSYKLATPLC